MFDNQFLKGGGRGWFIVFAHFHGAEHSHCGQFQAINTKNKIDESQLQHIKLNKSNWMKVADREV